MSKRIYGISFISLIRLYALNQLGCIMKVKEGVMMNRKDWFYSGIIAIFLLLMILSNIALIFMLLRGSYVWMILYGLSIAILLFGLTHRFYKKWGFSINQNVNWIKNHLIFWIMTDYMTLFMVARYIYPKERTNGFIPELIFGIHLLLIIPVYFSEKWSWYKKHELLLNLVLHTITYIMLSFNFIYFIIQTMS